MIYGAFHQGSGLGNQLHRYVATRVLAEDSGYEHGMIYVPDGSGKQKGFKGDFFIEQPNIVPSPYSFSIWKEKKVIENGLDIRPYDPEFNFIEDDTIIDGEFQDERYFKHRINDVREWLKVEPLDLPDDLCIIGFRGGEYKVYPDLYLTSDYWQKAIGTILEKYPNMRFEVHTDDVAEAQTFFPYPCVHDVALNWRSIRYAKHIIIANSSFFILPALLNEQVKEVIAPRYWARRNIGVWALPQNYYSSFTYL